MSVLWLNHSVEDISKYKLLTFRSRTDIAVAILLLTVCLWLVYRVRFE